MKYQIRTGDRTLRFEINSKVDYRTPTEVTVGKKNYKIQILEQTPGGEITGLAVDNRILSVRIRRHADGFPYKVIINGNAYPVSVERVESTRFKPQTKESSFDGELRASLPGLIRQILVAPGEKVSKGQVLLVLEAMKMENELSSPTDGYVASINVNEDELVSKNDLLVVLANKKSGS